jgi:hypothetical protein
VCLISSRLQSHLLARFAVFLREDDADAPFSPPNHIAVLPRLAGHYVQDDLVRNAERARDVERRTARRKVAYRAIDAGAIELDRSRFENSLPWHCASVLHSASLN